jgi:hypothetical protein
LNDLNQDPPLPGTLSFAQSLETLYNKGHQGMNYPTDIHRRASQVAWTEKDAMMDLTPMSSAPGSATTRTATNGSTFRIPRHMKWAIRTLCESDHRGLENVYRVDAIRQHREAVQKAILSQNGVVSDNTRVLLQQAAYVALLKGYGDAQQVELPASADPGRRRHTLSSSSSTMPRSIANPAA